MRRTSSALPEDEGPASHPHRRDVGTQRYSDTSTTPCCSGTSESCLCPALIPLTTFLTIKKTLSSLHLHHCICVYVIFYVSQNTLFCFYLF